MDDVVDGELVVRGVGRGFLGVVGLKVVGTGFLGVVGGKVGWNVGFGVVIEVGGKVG